MASSSSEYTRKSEGDSIELEDGRLLIVYMEFSGNGDDFVFQGHDVSAYIENLKRVRLKTIGELPVHSLVCES